MLYNAKPFYVNIRNGRSAIRMAKFGFLGLDGSRFTATIYPGTSIGANRLSRHDGKFPQAGQFQPLDPDLPPQRRDLAEALRGLIDLTGLSQRAIIEALGRRNISGGNAHLSRSVLSDLVNGLRVRAPREAPLRALYDFVRDTVGAERMTLSWEELSKLCNELSPLASSPRRRRSAGMCVGPATAADHVSSEAGPASPGTHSVEATVSVPPGVPPVRSSEGDRRNEEAWDLVWPPAADLRDYISSGNFERANGLIRHISIEAAPAEAAAAVVACRDLGLLDVVDTIIGYVGRRPERDVLRIVWSLNKQDRRADADAVVERALIAENPDTAGVR
ncbi:hypothetical protein [Nocardia sp. alder85J]|uniref:hypothetical protein n=1 Tax=Nocardia sp. alder85J TaxID=2862949 RepID=UPI001CD393B0|nr:hypothetical protein [Nocardia sp. alder85J]MCX4093960.1 hypothetical protein [Nocardia sp. alder85J]